MILSLYLPYIRLRKRSWQVDERILRQHILPTFARHPLQDISRNDVEIWLGLLAAKGLAPATCNRILSVFKSVCSLAVIWGVLPVSPCMGIAPFPTRQLRERYLTQHEARRLLQALHGSPRLEAKALQLLLLTGARKSEILKARWEHIHLEKHLLTVPLSKSNRPRHIVLSDEAVAIIRLLPRRPDCPWLFPGRTAGRPLSDIYLFWNHLRRQLNLADVRIHDLRHTFASILVSSMRYSGYWATVIRARPCAMPILGMIPCWQLRVRSAYSSEIHLLQLLRAPEKGCPWERTSPPPTMRC